MDPIQFDQSNIVLTPGENKNTNDLVAAVCLHTAYEDVPVIITRWKATPAELEKIKATGEIWLGVMGGTHPPVMLMAHNPFDEIGFEAVSPEEYKFRTE